MNTFSCYLFKILTIILIFLKVSITCSFILNSNFDDANTIEPNESTFIIDNQDEVIYGLPKEPDEPKFVIYYVPKEQVYSGSMLCLYTAIFVYFSEFNHIHHYLINFFILTAANSDLQKYFGYYIKFHPIRLEKVRYKQSEGSVPLSRSLCLVIAFLTEVLFFLKLPNLDDGTKILYLLIFQFHLLYIFGFIPEIEKIPQNMIRL